MDKWGDVLVRSLEVQGLREMESDNHAELVDALVYARRLAKIHQKDLAERIGVSAQHLNDIEHHRRRISTPVLVRLVAFVESQTCASDGRE